MKTSYKILLLCLFFTGSISAQTDTSYYSFVAKGKITGGQKTWKVKSNEYHYTYQYNDRGRGDSVTTTVITNEKGLFLDLKTTGIDYYKNPYSELFSVKGDSAVWAVNGERKSKKFSNELYGASTPPALLELFIRWALKQPDKRVALLPDGFMHVAEPLVKSITWNGKTEKLRLIALYFEPEPAPAYIWLTEDLHFFGSVSSWGANIRRGYEGLADSLFVLQEIAGQSYYSQQLSQNSSVLKSHIFFTHCTVFLSASAEVQKDMTVEVMDGKIRAIVPSIPGPIKSKADTVIDCKGKFLMPGIWDMHAHYAKDEGSAYLAGGVTHVRDMGNDKMILSYKKQISENQLLGPDISYLSGFIDKEDPFQGPTGKIVKTLAEGLSAIDEYHQSGYQQIKLYSAIPPEWVKPMALRAHGLGMKVCGHIPAFMTAEQAIRDGYDEITHMNFIFLNFMGTQVDTRTPVRFRLVGDDGGKLDLQSQKVKDFVGLMKTKNVALDPTLNVWQGMFAEFKGDTSGYLKPIVRWLPENMLSGLSNQSPFGQESSKTAYKASFGNMMKMLKLLYDNDVLLVAGTDGGEANALHHELELYVQAGIPANQVLKIATYNAALDCRLQNTSGSILVGRAADFILIDGNPVANIVTEQISAWHFRSKEEIEA